MFKESPDGAESADSGLSSSFLVGATGFDSLAFVVGSFGIGGAVGGGKSAAPTGAGGGGIGAGGAVGGGKSAAPAGAGGGGIGGIGGIDGAPEGGGIGAVGSAGGGGKFAASFFFLPRPIPCTYIAWVGNLS